MGASGLGSLPSRNNKCAVMNLMPRSGLWLQSGNTLRARISLTLSSALPGPASGEVDKDADECATQG